ncbi:MAG: cation diffusion facilitator family transporter [Clostridia bacterium]|nr:cation diffusion facilitator family transporter [Clostridia bacterium]
MKQRIKKSIAILAVGIAVNISLAIVKMYVGISSNSICIMVDAINSLLDIITCIITVIAFAVLFVPRSEKAPFGYGRSEYLSGFIVAVVSVVMGGLFFVRSLNRMAMPEPVWFGWQNCVLISVAVPIKLALGIFYMLCNRKLKSKAISALMLDSFLDVGITSASLVSFAVSSQVDYAVDAIFGMIISIVVVVFAVLMIIENVRCVVKGDGGEDEQKLISACCVKHSLIESVGRITLHDYGFGAKAGTVEVVFKDGVTLEEVEDVERELHENIKDGCGAQVWIVPRARKDVVENCDKSEDIVNITEN